eukprot:Phypoly_transcript_13044.p1 GENE.Phypoly_transcript_13044~~Phypoly_transcript_13044.p1  ORF type:complete len:276 (+),score=30.21 Phypoly_transcript_13044:59-886(+)
MGTDAIVSEVLGYIGLVLWSFQLAPQVYENYRDKDTGVLSIWMMVCWSLWTPFFAAAAIAKHLVAPNIIQPNIFAFFTTVCTVQVHIYNTKEKGRVVRGICETICGLAILGGLEVAFYFAAKSAGWVPQFLSSVAIAFIVGGFLPQYWTVLRNKDAEGISIAFLTLDITGGVVSVASLAFQHPFDGVSGGSYIAVILLDVGLVILHFVFQKKVPNTNETHMGVKTPQHEQEDAREYALEDPQENARENAQVDEWDDARESVDENAQDVQEVLVCD